MLVFILFVSPLCAQHISTKGQLFVGGLSGNDVPTGQSAFQVRLGYIPTLSITRSLSDFSFIDFEWAYKLGLAHHGGSFVLNYNRNHRLWVRYVSGSVELRLGLQKVVFGTSQILRTLSWFDSVDIKDPTGQTDGEGTLRIKWFSSNSYSVWVWAIQDKYNFISFGGRNEFSTGNGEWGLTVHHDPSEVSRRIGQKGPPIDHPHSRVAIDYRYDGLMGVWNESALIFSNDIEIGMHTLGTDYTLPFADGVVIMGEIMHVCDSKKKHREMFSAFMVSIPIGMVSQFMFIAQTDWTEKHTYNYVRWSVKYDTFSLNFIISKSPKRSVFMSLPQNYINNITNFGTGLQLMFIYDY